MRIACISAGKDSVAMLILCLRAGIRFDHMYYVYMRGAEWDETLDYVRHTLNPYLVAVFGRSVEVVGSVKSWDDLFYKTIRKSKKAYKNGLFYAFPAVNIGCLYQDQMKAATLERLYGKDNDVYIGIAADEAHRAERAMYKTCKNRYHFPLVEAGITEQQCYDLCKSLGLLHPFYKYGRRMGCWQCNRQSWEQLRRLYIDYPDKWAQLQKYQDDCVWDFRPGWRVEDIAHRIEMEGQQLTVDYYTTAAINGPNP